MIDDWRVKPFDECPIGFVQKSEGFADVPTTGVKVVFNGDLDRVAAFADGESMLHRAAVKKADVIVRIRRRKSPGPAAGLAGVEDLDAVFGFEFAQEGLDLFGHA